MSNMDIREIWKNDIERGPTPQITMEVQERTTKIKKLRYYCPQCNYEEFDEVHPLIWGRLFQPCPNGCVVDSPQILFYEEIHTSEGTANG